MNTSKLWKAAMTLSTAATLAACADSLSLSGTGEAAITMARDTSGPITFASQDGSASRSVSSDTVESFMVTVTAVQFLEAGANASDESGWTTVDIGHSSRINLMALPAEGAMAQLIAEGSVAAGSYRRVRLVVSSPTIQFKGDIALGVGTVLEGGVNYDVQLGSLSNTIEANASFEVQARSDSGSTRTSVDLVFDAGASLSSVSLSGSGDVIILAVVREE